MKTLQEPLVAIIIATSMPALADPTFVPPAESWPGPDDRAQEMAAERQTAPLLTLYAGKHARASIHAQPGSTAGALHPAPLLHLSNADVTLYCAAGCASGQTPVMMPVISG